MKIEGVISRPNREIVMYFRSKFGIELKTKCTNPSVLVLGGGSDIHPSLYYREEAYQTITGRINEDLREIGLVFEARAAEIPVVGICRGLQVMHVANGGTLMQHVEGHRGGHHKLYRRDPATATFKESDIVCNSTHHQAVPWREAMEKYESSLFGSSSETQWFAESVFDRERKQFGVQFHPERDTCPIAGRVHFEEKLQELMKG